MRAIVLSAGLGTRLRPLTDWLPKPLCPVGDRPQIDHVLARLAEAGIERAVVNTHHLAKAFDDAWAAAQPLPVVRVHEQEILGTGGGIASAAAELGEGAILVWNADILAQPDLAQLAGEAEGALAAFLTGPALPIGSGTLGLDQTGNVVRLRGKLFGVEARSADFAGISVIGPEARARLPLAGCLIGDVVLPLLGDGAQVRTVALAEPFVDTGSLESYLEANLGWLSRRAQPAQVGDGATVEPAVTLERSVVGAGATVRGTGMLSRCVVWPGAVAVAPLTRAIVTPRGIVAA